MVAFGEHKWSKDTKVTFGNGGKLGVASAEDVPVGKGLQEKVRGGSESGWGAWKALHKPPCR